MAQDYGSAAVRHFEDASTLRDAGRNDNAGHLVGFAAECAIKHQMSSFRAGSDSPHGHFPDFLITARKHLGPRSRYTPMFYVLNSEIFKGWHVNRRYEATGTTDSAELTGWFQEARRVFATAGLKIRK